MILKPEFRLDQELHMVNRDNIGRRVNCPFCSGKGKTIATFSNGMSRQIDCPECNGGGLLHETHGEWQWGTVEPETIECFTTGVNSEDNRVFYYIYGDGEDFFYFFGDKSQAIKCCEILNEVEEYKKNNSDE